MITTSLKKEFPARNFKEEKICLNRSFFSIKKICSGNDYKENLNAAYFNLKFDRAGNLK